ncbi:hypothetical protein C0099_11065 [Pseudazoarcus pumilus]|uniref:DUF2116 family Zn-ribbon domain-containing protein n=1 Tax=Pseudazoarcus pumilus TaxID=2067960 RepID=A0A2I6S825_9RHOO|nr:hypothetical protein C0099_11065 [Pseudazoarcus pumilus]
MTDVSDRATEREELDRELALRAARAARDVPPLPCGTCHNCGERLPPGLPFCDADCRDDWQLRRRQSGC